jgi:hypothetical protein
MTTIQVPESDPLYDMVMSDDDARKAYFNTTKGVLTGRPDDEDLRRARTRLDESGIAYLYNPDSLRPRPMFLTHGRAIVGLEQIEKYILSLQTTPSA